MQMIKRFIRLFLPVTAAVLLAIGLSLAIPSVKDSVAHISYSAWADALFRNALTPASLVKELIASSMILGYDGVSIFSSLARLSPRPIFSPMTVSMDPPLWTIHIEFWCSIGLIAVGYAYRRFAKRLFWPFFTFVCWVSGTSWFSLFLIGFATHQCLNSLPAAPSAPKSAFGVLLGAAGIYFSTCVDPANFDAPLAIISKFTFFKAGNGAQLQSEFSAVLILASVVFLPTIRRLLSSAVPMWLGKISFSLYLIHFPILFTVGFQVFIRLARYFSYGIAATLTFVMVGALTLLISHAFQKLIDQKAIHISRKATGSANSSSRRKLSVS
jgi:peptidoglycan/LPS O-acetylase OafA/YrhL